MASSRVPRPNRHTGPAPRPGSPHLAHGAAAEALAARHLESRGLTLVARNFRCRFGELDLVMADGPVLVVVEVRSRRRTTVATPAATVTRGKQRRIIGATRFLLTRFRWLAERPVRFDVVEVTGELASPTVRWWRAAFTLDDVAGR
jgi:putative endonuclease